MDVDVIVIGAGISGLAAAGELAKKGWNVRILEARDRTGGRILSVKPDGWPVAAELGAEFIHGGNAAMCKYLHDAEIRTRSVDTNVWWRDESSGILALMQDYWGQIGRVVDQIPSRTPGWSFEKFLRSSREKVSPGDRFLAGHYVGSFEAAPITKISASALREDRAGTATNDLKVQGRYDRLVRSLEQCLPVSRVELRLKSPVSTIQWENGKATVKTKRPGAKRTTKHESRAVVVTLPLGVLQARKVKFSPALQKKEKLIGRLGWGHVVRIVFRFKPGFWSAPFMPRTLGGRQGRDFGFVNAPGQPIPVWWALTPPAPILTGWAGGDASKPLRHRPPSAVRDKAFHSLSVIFGTTASQLRRWVSDWQCHQWSDDPFSLGSYSFPVAGLEQGAEELSRPISSTLFFAGEATAREYGTVHGALESGLRVAHEVSAALTNAIRY